MPSSRTRETLVQEAPLRDPKREAVNGVYPVPSYSLETASTSPRPANVSLCSDIILLVYIVNSMSVLSVALRGTSFQYYEHEAYRPMYSWQMAATVLTTVPLLVLFIIFRKYIMRGIARAGIKG